MGFSQERRRKQRRRSFKDSLKALEADIQFANALASDYPRDFDGACLQMRLSYSPAAQFLLVLFQWTDCHLAGAFGLLRILVYKAYDNGKTTMTVYERKASLKEFYGVIFPSLLQLQRGITDAEDRRQKDLCATKYKSVEAMNKREMSEIDIEGENECDICMEMNRRVVLPVCSHSMCMKCYRDWRARSQSCPFCRGNLTRVNSGDLWIYVSSNDIEDLDSIIKENVNRLFMYIEKLPRLVPDPSFASYLQHW
ncbi:E3 ubiquitin-protein ligase AIRP2-like isoform X2 [Prosopis cineraria]|uniref:E3 ubiquitin-protein ligase AIRP2-like isoform X2 n=1 Tax=Prosopis cineraria TaxID=364024 RepID=UPI0024100527|nr:E3 ubiquitin-protein ligase AIRP2-like isoform X2 [Prosopis cineraria]